MRLVLNQPDAKTTVYIKPTDPRKNMCNLPKHSPTKGRGLCAMPLHVLVIVTAIGLHVLFVVTALRAMILCVLGVIHVLLVTTSLIRG